MSHEKVIIEDIQYENSTENSQNQHVLLKKLSRFLDIENISNLFSLSS